MLSRAQKYLPFYLPSAGVPGGYWVGIVVEEYFEVLGVVKLFGAREFGLVANLLSVFKVIFIIVSLTIK